MRADRKNKGGLSQRHLRVGEVVRRELAHMFSHGLLSAPEFENISVTVSEARMSPDLRTAKIYVLPLGGKDGAALVKYLNHNAGKFRGTLGRAAGLRFAPALHFLLDDSFDYAEKIDSLLSEAGHKSD